MTGGETKAVFTEPSFQLGSWRGTHQGAGEKGGFPVHWDGGESGVQLCAGGMHQAMGCSSSRCIPLSSALPSSAACQLGFYKSAPGDQLCAKCPLHSHSESRAARVCRCDSSFYRAVQDPPSAACTREYPGCTQQMLQAELIMHPCLCACCPRCCSSLSTLRLPLAQVQTP